MESSAVALTDCLTGIAEYAVAPTRFNCVIMSWGRVRVVARWHQQYEEELGEAAG